MAWSEEARQRSIEVRRAKKRLRGLLRGRLQMLPQSADLKVVKRRKAVDDFGDRGRAEHVAAGYVVQDAAGRMRAEIEQLAKGYMQKGSWKVQTYDLDDKPRYAAYAGTLKEAKEKALQLVRKVDAEAAPGEVKALPQAAAVKQDGSPQPGDIPSMSAARTWMHDRGLHLNIPGVTNMEAINGMITAVDKVTKKYPHIRKGLAQVDVQDWREYDRALAAGEEPPAEVPWHKANWRFRGLATFKSKLCPQRVRAHAADAWGATDNRADGVYIYVNEDGGVGANKGAGMLAEIGYVNPAAISVEGAVTHELGHVFLSTLPVSDHRRHSMVRRSAEAAGYTPELIAKDISGYATRNPDEFFAELFLVLNTSGAFEKMRNDAARKRVLRFVALFNKAMSDRGLIGVTL
jgi:hypothetical protein